jgi:internalin A
MARDEVFRNAERKIEKARRTGADILDLSDKKLTELPESLGALTQLQWLSLAGNQLTQLPESLGALTQLKYLGLSDNQLTQLPESLGALTQLQHLFLAENQLTRLPNLLGALTQLQELDLSNNQLTQLPDSLGALTQLQELNLLRNQMTDLPKSLALLGKLRSLDLRANPLSPELAAAYAEGIKAVQRYLRAKAQDQVTLNEAKLLFIGEGDVGKSCLLSAPRDEPFIEGKPTTHGIEIKPLEVVDSARGTTIILNG